MTRVILTTSDSGSGCLKQTGIADMIAPIGVRFAVKEQVPSENETRELLSTPSSDDDPDLDAWLFRIYERYLDERAGPSGLVHLCDQFDVIDLWIDPDPNAQLILMWTLYRFRSHKSIISKMNLVQADVPIGDLSPEQAAALKITPIKITEQHLELADSARLAFRASTPQPWFDLLATDLTALPLFRSAVIALLEELPGLGSGLGATEMRMLELIGEGNAGPPDVFPGHQKRNKRRVFNYWQIGALLDDLANAPAPAVAGLDEGPFTLEMHDDAERHRRYFHSKLSLTPLGKAIVAGEDDFTRHNPIRRWWAWTELTNDHLWHWNPATQTLMAP